MLLGALRLRLPVRHEVREEAQAAPGVLAQLRVPAVAVEADGGLVDEHGRPVALGQ